MRQPQYVHAISLISRRLTAIYYYIVQTISHSYFVLSLIGTLSFRATSLYSTHFFVQIFLLHYAFDSRLAFNSFQEYLAQDFPVMEFSCLDRFSKYITVLSHSSVYGTKIRLRVIFIISIVTTPIYICVVWIKSLCGRL